MSERTNKESLNKMVEYAMLYDFYGALLKEKNQAVFEDYMFNDMSLSEIGDELGITRQGVRDIVERSKKSLERYEDSLGLIKRFNNAKDNVSEARSMVNDIRSSLTKGAEIEDLNHLLGDIDDKLNEIIEEF